jgi:sugar phosphate isomerase/epimerase
MLDLPEFIRDIGFDGLEMSDRKLLRFDKNLPLRLSEKCSQNNCGLILDVNADLSFSKDDLRIQEIKHVKRMIHMANSLNISLLRICLGGQFISIQNFVRKYHKAASMNESLTISDKTAKKKASIPFVLGHIIRLSNYFRRYTTSKIINLEKKKAGVIKSLEEIMEDIDRYKIKLGIENHWGVSSRPEDIMEIISIMNSPHLGTCPDFSNFPRDIDPFQGLELMAPRAVIVHAKCYGFDNNWKDRRVDFNKCLKIFHKSEYKGPVTVEYEGWGDDLKNCKIARQLIHDIFREKNHF